MTKKGKNSDDFAYRDRKYYRALLSSDSVKSFIYRRPATRY